MGVFSVVWMLVVLIVLFGMLVSEIVGPDLSMATALTMCTLGGLISVDEAVAGFSNEGLLTVMALYVVASGISHTGGLDWYMSKALGKPKMLCMAQLRLMIPVAIASALFNNTPLVAIMIPIVQSWSKKIGVSPSQLLLHLSFASILGGTVTIIGTSTNLVVVGLLAERYPNDYAEEVNIGLFDVGLYGVPVALVGFAYMVTFSKLLLPSDKGSSSGSDAFLVSATIMRWSPACDTTVADSGLRGLPGLFLVTVHKRSTGTTLRAVGPDVMLQEGDRLDFSGVVESFGKICDEYGLQPITNENELSPRPALAAAQSVTGLSGLDKLPPTPLPALTEALTELEEPREEEDSGGHGDLSPVGDGGAVEPGKWGHMVDSGAPPPPMPQALVNPQHGGMAARLEAIKLLRDLIRSPGDLAGSPSPGSGPGSGAATPRSPSRAQAYYQAKCQQLAGQLAGQLALGEALGEARRGELEAEMRRATQRATECAKQAGESGPKQGSLGVNEMLNSLAPATIVVVPDPVTSKKNVCFIGVNAADRPGLIHDLSKGLARLSLQVLHNEAAVVGLRSISVWRVEVGGGLRAERRRRFGLDETDLEEIWSVLNALLETETGTEAIKKRGLRVLRATIPPGSSLVGKTANESGFKTKFLSAIVAVQRAGGQGTQPGPLKLLRFAPRDVLVLQVGEDSALLTVDFARAQRRAMQASGTSGAVTPTRHQSKDRAANLARPTPLSGPVTGGGGFPAPSSSINQLVTEAAEEAEGAVGQEGAASALSGADQLEAANLAMDRLARDLRLSSKIQEVPLTIDEEEDEERPSLGGDAAVGREFLAAYFVSKKSPLLGRTVKEAGISNLPGVFLVSIERPVSESNNNVPASATADTASSASDSGQDSSLSSSAAELAKVTISVDEKLRPLDILWWSGDGTSIGNLRKIPGLEPFEKSQVKKLRGGHDRRLVQAVVARTGPLIGKTIKELKFRTRFNCAVISVSREGTRIQQHTGGIALQAGDVLLLEAGPNFVRENTDNSKCFALLSEIQDSTAPRMKLLGPSLLLTAAMLAVYMLGLCSLLMAALSASICMVALGVLTQTEARDAVNWEIFVTIASAFGIGSAMVNSGVAGAVAEFLVSVGGSFGSSGLFAMVYLATVLVSNVVTNNAAAALIFPVAMEAAERAGVRLENMAFAIMLAASASFMTPFGYQTNLMVYGPGSYRTMDFLRFGTPMQVGLWVWSVLLLGVGDAQKGGAVAVFFFWAVGAAALFVAVLVQYALLWKRGGAFRGQKSTASPLLAKPAALTPLEPLPDSPPDSPWDGPLGPCATPL